MLFFFHSNDSKLFGLLKFSSNNAALTDRLKQPGLLPNDATNQMKKKYVSYCNSGVILIKKTSVFTANPLYGITFYQMKKIVRAICFSIWTTEFLLIAHKFYSLFLRSFPTSLLFSEGRQLLSLILRSYLPFSFVLIAEIFCQSFTNCMR